ncbi:MAG: phosphoenolpyruvate--protein phosphotransferase [Proteobacteria bacterium]|nr:phosphoenolpyruvate--protein phosphotransferase [Pseudomonadota bacterium]MDE3207752.1 phosphoenolpyruvate--protein phosphotransferase [Pseudomonadota bacterium]
MSFTMHGIGVSGGIAIGYAHLVSHATLEVAHYSVPRQKLEEEYARFDEAILSVRQELETLCGNIPPSAPGELAAILNMHLMILNDSTLSVTPKRIVEEQGCNAEWALKQQMDALVSQFEGMDDTYLRERKTDVVQVVERVLKALMGHGVGASAFSEENSILVAHDLSPADVILFKRHHFGAFITDVGGVTSHTAILARSLSIPSIVALHHARRLIRENELLIVDGTQGVVIVSPDKQVLSEYRLRQETWEIEKQKLKRIRTTRTATIDGTSVDLHANIELPGDIEQVRESGATGIGLFRSEFLFLNREDLPDEEEQFQAYRLVAEGMRGRKVVIRTLDLGADKSIAGETRTSVNPALGLRAIRYCLAEPVLFYTQLRAILRASKFGNVWILVPMISNLSEIMQMLGLIERAKISLREEGIPFNEKTPVGGMIEVPAAALSTYTFAQKLDFLSIGTNDLISYTLAIDRADDSVAHLYDQLHPAVLYLVARAIKDAHRAGKPISVCGEMAGDASMTRILLGMGLREFSMHPSHILSVKQQILKTDIPSAMPITSRLLRMEDGQKIRSLIQKLNA